MLLEALPAVYRTALGGLERNLAILAAVRALCLGHLSGATEAPASSSVFISHVIHSLYRLRPRESCSFLLLPLRVAVLPNHLHRWFVWEYIILLVSKDKRPANSSPQVNRDKREGKFRKIIEFYTTLPLTFFAPQNEHTSTGSISPNPTSSDQRAK